MSSIDRAELAREFQRGLGREIPDEPTTAALLDHDLRRRCAAVVLEEAFELVEALGCRVHAKGSRHVVTGDAITVSVDAKRHEFDLVEAAHEAGDVAYSNETLSVMLGIDLSDVYAELHTSNMTKILPNGTLLRHPRKSNDPRYRYPDIGAAIGVRRDS